MGNKNKRAEIENSVSGLEEKDEENFQKVEQEDKQVKIRRGKKKDKGNERLSSGD